MEIGRREEMKFKEYRGFTVEITEYGKFTAEGPEGVKMASEKWESLSDRIDKFHEVEEKVKEIGLDALLEIPTNYGGPPVFVDAKVRRIHRQNGKLMVEGDPAELRKVSENVTRTGKATVGGYRVYIYRPDKEVIGKLVAYDKELDRLEKLKRDVVKKLEAFRKKYAYQFSELSSWHMNQAEKVEEKIKDFLESEVEK